MKKKCILDIDTGKREETVVRLTCDGKIFEKRKNGEKGSSQQVLPLIESLVREAECAIGDISAIHVYTGPGSYTGLRVGVAIATMLGAMLDVPVNGSKKLTPPITYEKDPWV
jgi:tRNA threonylcarbamoyladenosine biosynthesis protein TsaB